MVLGTIKKILDKNQLRVPDPLELNKAIINGGTASGIGFLLGIFIHFFIYPFPLDLFVPGIIYGMFCLFAFFATFFFRETLPIIIMMLGAFFSIISFSIFLPQIQNESLFAFSAAFSGFLYIKDKQHGKLHLIGFIIFGFIIQFYELFLEPEVVVSNPAYLFANKLIMLIAMGYVSFTVLFYTSYFLDVNEELKGKVRLKEESDLRFQMFFENVTEAVVVFNSKNDTLIKANKEFKRLFKWDDELYGTSMLDLSQIIVDSQRGTPSTLSVLKRKVEESFVKNNSPKFDFYFKTLENEILETETSIIISQYHPEEYLLVIKDNTLLSASEKKFRLFFDTHTTAVGIYDTQKHAVENCNQKVVEVFGYDSAEEIIGRSIREFVENEQIGKKVIDDYFNLYRKAIHQKSEHEFIIKAKKKNGDTFIAEVVLLTNTLENPNKVTIFFTDITEQFNSEKKSKEQKAIFQSVLENAYDGIDIHEIPPSASGKGKFGSDHILISRNKVMTRFLGDAMKPFSHPDNILPKLSPIQPNGQDRETMFKEFFNGLVKTNLQTARISLILPDKSECLLDVVVTIIPVEGKWILVRNFRDVTKLNEQEDKIRHQLEDLNKKNQELKNYIDSNMKLEQFAYSAAHDLQAPVRSINSFTQLLERNIAKYEDPTALEFMGFIKMAARNMDHLIKGLLAYSKINSNQVELSEIGISNLIEQAKIELYNSIQNSNAEIIIGEIPNHIYSDRLKIKQIFQNLLSNGIKFVDKGVTPRIHISGSQKGNIIEFSFRDNGIGIKEEHKSKVFQIFKKLNAPSKYEGSGIGLALCQKLAEQLGGKLEVKSEFGVGSVFLLTISDQQN